MIVSLFNDKTKNNVKNFQLRARAPGDLCRSILCERGMFLTDNNYRVCPWVLTDNTGHSQVLLLTISIGHTPGSSLKISTGYTLGSILIAIMRSWLIISTVYTHGS